MVLSSEELDRIADELYLQRRITGSFYCGNCGYNLHSLPYIHTCPECGNQYNARPLKMTGIFMPHETDPPIGDAGGSIFCALATALLFFCALGQADPALLVMSLVFAAMFIVFSVKFFKRLARYIKACSILHRIRRDERESDLP